MTVLQQSRALLPWTHRMNVSLRDRCLIAVLVLMLIHMDTVLEYTIVCVSSCYLFLKTEKIKR